jgi:predicted Rossmann-fold nucleotide-binding protein
MLKSRYINDADYRMLHLTDSPAEVVEIIVRSMDTLDKLHTDTYDY